MGAKHHIMFVNTPLNEQGRYRANPYADSDNSLRLVDDCSCDTAKSCQDLFSGTVAGARTVASITYNGVVYPTPTGTLAKDDLQAFIQGILVSRTETDGEDRETEVDPYVLVTYEGTTLTVEHIGQGTLSLITYDNDDTSALTRVCDLFNLYKYNAIGVVGTVGPLMWMGQSEALANEPYAYTGTSGTDAATATQLQTDLGTALTALGVPNATAAVAVNDTDSNYTVTIQNTSNEPVKVGDVYLTLDEVVQVFISQA